MRQKAVILAIVATAVLVAGLAGLAAADVHSSADDDSAAETSDEPLYVLEADDDGDSVEFEIVKLEGVDRVNLSGDHLFIESGDEPPTTDDLNIIEYREIEEDDEMELEDLDSDVLVYYPVDN